MLKFHFLNSAQYAALDTKNADHLYFLSDTRKIFRGTVDFTESVRLVADFPESAISQGVLYIKTSTGEGKVYNGSTWTTVIRAVDTTVTEDSANLVTSGAVYTAIEDAIGGIDNSNYVTNFTWDAANHKFILAKGAAETDVNLTNVATQLDYDATTGTITLQDAAGTTLDTITIPLDNFVNGGTYNAATGNIELTLTSGSTVYVPASALVDTYYGNETSTTITSVETVNTTAEFFMIDEDKFYKVGSYAVSAANFAAGNTTSEYEDATATAAMATATLTEEVVDSKETIKVNVKIASAQDAPNNALQISANGGLYVDVSGKMDKVTSATAGDIATVTAAGGIADSGKTIGAGTFTFDAGQNSDEASANRLATEAGVVAYAVAKTVPTTAGEIATLTNTGDLNASGKTVGGATITRDYGASANAASPNRLATEAAVDAAIAGFIPASSINTDLTTGTPTDSQVPSAAAIIDLLTWETHSGS